MKPRRQRFSISTNILTKYTLLDSLGIIAGSGFRGVEILADKPHAYPPDMDEAAIVRVNTKLRKHGLMVANINANTSAGYFSGPPVPDNFEPSLINPKPELRLWRVQYTIQALKMAVGLRSRNISICSGPVTDGQTPQQAYELFKASLQDILPAADEANVNVGIEYEPGHLIGDCKILLELIGEINHARLGANFDVGHAAVNGEDVADTIRKIGPRIFHVHMDDIRAQKHEHLAPGFGELDFPKILDAFDEIDYGGFLTWELYPYRETPREALYITRAFINEVLEA